MRSLYQSLLDSELPRLQAIARFWEVELKADRHRDVAEQLARALSTPERVIDAWETLPDALQRVVQALLENEGQMPTPVFTRKWGEIRTMGPGRMEREQPWRHPASPGEALWYTGFIGRSFEQEGEKAYEVIFIPQEIGPHLPAEATPSPPRLSLSPMDRPAIVHAEGDALLEDACTLLAYIQHHHPPHKKDGTWQSYHEQQLHDQLCDRSPDRLAFLHHATNALGWIQPTESHHLRLVPPKVTQWLRSSPYEQRCSFAELWRDDDTWNDLFHVPSLQPDATGSWSNDPVLARKAILNHLQDCEAETWYSLEAFIQAVKETTPDFQRPDGDYESWYIRESTTGAYLSGFESWEVVEGALIRYLLTHPLSWFDFVQTGSETEDAPPGAFCVTPSGAAFFTQKDPPPSPEPPPLTIRPDFTIFSPMGPRYKRFQLSRVADWEETGKKQFRYRITPQSLSRAEKQAISVDRILSFLDEAIGTTLPRYLEAALTRWQARGTEARLKHAVLLQLSDEELMTQIVSTPATNRLIEERIGPTAALVDESNWQRLIAALGQIGLLPDIDAMEEPNGT